MVRVLGFGVAAVMAGGVLLSAGAAQACGVGECCPTWRCGFNGTSLNGWSLNGARLNGMVLNGVKLNGPGLVLQGTSPQGVAQTRQSEAAAANLRVTGIRLADGTELAVTAP